MFRAIPELRKVLDRCVELYRASKLTDKIVRISTSAPKTLGELGRLYTSMSQTTDAVDPTPFIKSLESDFFRELTILNLENEPVVVDDVGYRYPEPGDLWFCLSLGTPFQAILIKFYQTRAGFIL